MQDVFDFGLNIKRLREQRGLTQKQLSKMVGITEATISGYESNTTTPALDKFIKLGLALSVSLDSLAGINPCPENIVIEHLTGFQKNLLKDIIKSWS